MKIDNQMDGVPQSLVNSSNIIEEKSNNNHEKHNHDNISKVEKVSFKSINIDHVQVTTYTVYF